MMSLLFLSSKCIVVFQGGNSQQLRGELFAKGVNPKAIQQAMETHNEKESIERLMETSMRLHNKSDEELKKFLENKVGVVQANKNIRCFQLKTACSMRRGFLQN